MAPELVCVEEVSVEVGASSVLVVVVTVELELDDELPLEDVELDEEVLDVLDELELEVLDELELDVLDELDVLELDVLEELDEEELVVDEVELGELVLVVASAPFPSAIAPGAASPATVAPLPARTERTTRRAQRPAKLTSPPRFAGWASTSSRSRGSMKTPRSRRCATTGAARRRRLDAREALSPCGPCL